MITCLLSITFGVLVRCIINYTHHLPPPLLATFLHAWWTWSLGEMENRRWRENHAIEAIKVQDLFRPNESYLRAHPFHRHHHVVYDKAFLLRALRLDWFSSIDGFKSRAKKRFNGRNQITRKILGKSSPVDRPCSAVMAHCLCGYLSYLLKVHDKFFTLQDLQHRLA